MQKNVFFQKSGINFWVIRKIFVPLQPISKKQHRGVEQLVARQAHNLEVARSNPASATTRKLQAIRKRIRFDALHTIGPSIGQAAESCTP